MNRRSKIILVDDNISNLEQGKQMLNAFYEAYPLPSAAKLFEMLEHVVPELILLDVNMPEINGYEAIKKLKSDERFADIPVIFLTANSDERSEREGFDLGAADYVAKPFSAPLLQRRIENQLTIVRKTNELKDYANNLENLVREKTKDIVDLQNAVLATVADLVEFRDNSTGGHIMRTQFYFKVLVGGLRHEPAYKDKIAGWDLDLVLQSAQLHDVGKIGITDMILNKPGKLTPEEFNIMKTHVAVGTNAIKRIMSETAKHAFLEHALVIAGTHHEKWDGSGYPMGLKGTDIPLQGRLMAIVDVYDALVSERAYKKAFSHEKACQIIEKEAGTHFDPALIDVFRSVKDEFSADSRILYKYAGGIANE